MSISKPDGVQDPAMERILGHIADEAMGVLHTEDAPTTDNVPLGKAVVCDDGDGEESVSFRSGKGNVITLAPVPAGGIMDYGGATAPEGWLLCNGDAVSRTEYAKLFAAIGVIYGSGDGSTTFNLPDSRGRTSVGLADSGTFNSLGKEEGDETHLLALTEIPAHNHGISGIILSNSSGSPYAAFTGDGKQLHYSPNTGSSGGGLEHNNIQPSIVFNKIIKT